MKLAFIVDPLEGLKAYKDSSIAMMREAAARGHQVYAIQRQTLVMRDGVVSAAARALQLSADDAQWCQAAPPHSAALASFDAVLMRQDPPFDFEYLTATWLLERAQAQGARIWNSPRAIRDHSEKVAIGEFPALAPPTLVARDPAVLQQFVDEFGDSIVKPLDGMGGSGIFRVRSDDPNRNAIIETLTDNGRRSAMAQRYVEQISAGDKRILIIAGEVQPYCLARIPKPGETRGNLAAGGQGVVQALSPRDEAIAATLAPILWARGLLIVGIDVIGDYLTEINVTSPTCMVEIARESDCRPAARVIDALEADAAA